MDVILKIIQVIVSLSLLVLVHEFGHFVFARIFGMRVEKFYLFFPPSLLSFKPKNSDTEFGIGSIPLGGFCKISGMVDESMDTDGMESDPQPYEFRGKPAWQRLCVLAGGVLFNFILAIVLYSSIFAKWGEEYVRNSDAVYGIEVSSLAQEVGFRSGDVILSFDGVSQIDEDFSQLQVNLLRLQAKEATVLRGSDTVRVMINEAYFPAILNSGMFGLRTRTAVAEIPDTSLNITSGMQRGDVFKRIGDVEVLSFSEVQAALSRYRDTLVDVDFIRNGEIVTIPLMTDDAGKIQVLLQGDLSGINVTVKKYSFVTAIRAGFLNAVGTVGGYVRDLGLVFTPKTGAYKSVGSFIAIGSIFPSSWNWQIFWNICAYLSVMLAVLNLIPIPGLDGGHILFTLWEMITRRKPSVRFLYAAQMIGMIILLALVMLAFGNDITRLIK